jgi:hypothetical protein
VRLPVARTDGSTLHMDPRVGLLFDDLALGPFLDEALAGRARGYLQAPWDRLPEPLQRELPLPDLVGDAPWRVRKLWCAPSGTVTPLHRDLAENLHSVLRGRKRYLLYPRSPSASLYPQGLFSGVPNFSRVDPLAPDLGRFPRFAEARAWECELGAGDTLFIPHGWWHHVRTVETTLSINCFFCRGPRLALVVGADIFKRLRGVSR